MSSGFNDQAKLIRFSELRNHGWGHVAVHPCRPHVLITKLYKPSHDGFIPTVNELNEGGGQRYSPIHPQSHAPLQEFAGCIASLVLQLLIAAWPITLSEICGLVI